MAATWFSSFLEDDKVFADKPTNALAQGAVETLDMLSVFALAVVLISKDNGLISLKQFGLKA
jgi:hypothetical protein